ncbi:MAG: phosphate acyltransferase PlsX [Candidatus Heteroscillospira sp.]|jgi:glycerol-3-phosphate acyltransferase PlsX
MRIIIDAMGGDNAPSAAVHGAVDAAREFGIDITLVGDADAIESCLREKNAGADGEHIRVVPTSEVITMEDEPSMAVRVKNDSSMAVGLRLLSRGEGDAFVSAGSTGALLSGATMTVRRVKGIRRAALAPVVPNAGHGVLLIDCGANIECTDEYLLQFAYMGSFYAKNIMGLENPRVSQLNIGVEAGKGGQRREEAYDVLKAAGDAGRINFTGNIEAREAMLGHTDVLVCDGFTGNIFLKTVEGTALFLLKELKGAFLSSLKNKLGALLLKGGVMAIKDKVDVSETGGTIMLGLRRTVVKAHGSSNARAFRSAIKQAVGFVEADVIGEIERNVEYMKLDKES